MFGERNQANELPVKRRRAFTLVEMLVVITIIGVLAGLLIPAVYVALQNAKVARITLEIEELSRSVEQYKQKYGDYPPSTPARLDAHLRKAFPRIQEPAAVLNLVRRELKPESALGMWLGGLSNDPKRPFSGPGGPIDAATLGFRTLDARSNALFEFEIKRVEGGNTYKFHPDGLSAPYVYFHSQEYAGAYYDTGSEGSICKAYLSDRPNPNGAGNLFMEASTFQIISAGLDDHYGFYASAGAAPAKQFPSGLNYDISNGRYDLDNVANFSKGAFEDDADFEF